MITSISASRPGLRSGWCSNGFTLTAAAATAIAAGSGCMDAPGMSPSTGSMRWISWPVRSSGEYGTVSSPVASSGPWAERSRARRGALLRVTQAL